MVRGRTWGCVYRREADLRNAPVCARPSPRPSPCVQGRGGEARSFSRACPGAVDGACTTGVPKSRSSHDVPDGRAVVDLEALAAGDVELARVEAEEVHHRRVNVGDVVRVFDGVEAELVRCAVDRAALDAAAGEPDGETVRVV